MPSVNTLGFQAGAYKLEYKRKAGSYVDMGRTLEGFRKIARPSFVPIRADNTGQVMVDGIATGLELLMIRFETIEYSTAVWERGIEWLLGGDNTTPIGSTQGVVAQSGMLISNLAGSLKITPLNNANQEVYEYGRAWSLGSVETLFSSQRLRTTPLEFIVFASSVDTNKYTATMYTVA